MIVSVKHIISKPGIQIFMGGERGVLLTFFGWVGGGGGGAERGSGCENTSSSGILSVLGYSVLNVYVFENIRTLFYNYKFISDQNSSYTP